MSAVPALLEMERARIDVGGAPLTDRMSVVSRGDRVALVGDWRGLFLLLGAQANVVAGRVTIDGCDAARAAALGVVGLSQFEPALAPAWTGEQYLTWSARLRGVAPRAARLAAGQALDALGLAALCRRKLGTFMPMEQRALMLAHATLGGPRVVVLDRPLARLDEPAQRWLRELLDRAAAGRRSVVSVEDALSPGVERALVEDFDEVIVMGRSQLVAHGNAATALTADGRYLVTVLRKAAPLAARLVQLGARVDVTTDSGALESVNETGAPIDRDAARLVVAMPEGADPGVVLETSAELGAPVIELVALGFSSPQLGARPNET